MKYKKVFLIILDGFGLASKNPDNAILAGGIPYLDSLIDKYPTFSIVASSLVVGLPWGNQGNSEVGHSAIGTGRVLIQDLARINKEIRGGEFFENEVLLKAAEYAKKNDSTIHFVGCMSPGGIHSHEDHLISLFNFAKKQKLEKISAHIFTDGRDAGPNDAANSWKKVKPAADKVGAKVSSICGRMYSMDRILDWALTEAAWKGMMGVSEKKITDIAKYLDESYKAGKTDYDIEPASVEGGLPIQDNDAVVFFHFRNDRMIQMVGPFAYKDFSDFNREPNPQNLYVVTMTRYKEDFGLDVVYPPSDIKNSLGEMISKNGLKQWRIAEKEKEAHVTNFFNGGKLDPWEGEERLIVSSRKMKGDEYLEHPEMSAEKVVSEVLARKDGDASLFVINFANPDMIAHTGDFNATVKAIQITDMSLKTLVPEIIKNPEYAVIITADHGNAEELVDPETGGKDTQHSTRNVPMIFVGNGLELLDSTGKTLEMLANDAPFGSVVDVAPSVLELLGIEKPKEMVGNSLLSS